MQLQFVDTKKKKEENKPNDLNGSPFYKNFFVSAIAKSNLLSI